MKSKTFTDAEVLLILCGIKTQFRLPANCPQKFQKGDKIAVKEAFIIETNFGLDHEATYPPPFSDDRPVRRHGNADVGEWWQQMHYRANDEFPELLGEDGRIENWQPASKMPIWAARTFLQVESVGAEHLGDISEADAMAEGAEKGRFVGFGAIGETGHREGFLLSFLKKHRKLSPRSVVWKISFKLISRAN